MDEARPLAEFKRRGRQQPVDMTMRLRAALHRKSRRLVEDEEVLVLVNHHVCEKMRAPPCQKAVTGGVRACPAGRD